MHHTGAPRPDRVASLSARARYRLIAPHLNRLILNATRSERSDVRSTDLWLISALAALAAADLSPVADCAARARAACIEGSTDAAGKFRCADAAARLEEALAAAASLADRDRYDASQEDGPLNDESLDDRLAHRERSPDASALNRVTVWLPHIRSPFNLGNILRTAATFGVTNVIVGTASPALDHPRTVRAAMGALNYLNVEVGEAAPAAGSGALVALETGGTPIDSFVFPSVGVLVVGHEQVGLAPDLIERAAGEGGVVTIPHGGIKRSLNVGVAVGIALSWWERQRDREPSRPSAPR